MKVHFRYTESDSWAAPLLKPQAPAIYDLFSDPGETLNLMDSGLTVAWVVRDAMQPLIELQLSAEKFPHVPVGAEFTGYEVSRRERPGGADRFARWLRLGRQTRMHCGG